jgi:hypothetical protein
MNPQKPLKHDARLQRMVEELRASQAGAGDTGHRG